MIAWQLREGYNKVLIMCNSVLMSIFVSPDMRGSWGRGVGGRGYDPQWKITSCHVSLEILVGALSGSNWTLWVQLLLEGGSYAICALGPTNAWILDDKLYEGQMAHNDVFS